VGLIYPFFTIRNKNNFHLQIGNNLFWVVIYNLEIRLYTNITKLDIQTLLGVTPCQLLIHKENIKPIEEQIINRILVTGSKMKNDIYLGVVMIVHTGMV